MCEACEKLEELGKIAGAARDHEEAVGNVADAAMALADADVEMGPETTTVPSALYAKLLDACVELEVAQEIAVGALNAAVERFGGALVGTENETGGLPS